MPLALYLGIDGGGTGTTAWAADDRGRVLGRGESGPSNPVKVGLGAAKREILAAARRALAAAPRAKLRSVCLGLAGADRPEVSRPLTAWLRRQLPAETHLLTTDAAITLQAALGNSPGVLVIAGTGSIACARDREGRMLRTGGWGNVFGDEGSGYDLGRKAVRAALGELDGRGPSTRLGKMISRSLGLADLSQIIGRDLQPQQIAALASLVIAAARSGDAVARRILEEAGRDLAELAATLVRRLGMRRQRVSVVCAGGLLRSSAALVRSFRRHLVRQAPGARVSVIRRQPVEGALTLAIEADESRSEPNRA